MSFAPKTLTRNCSYWNLRLRQQLWTSNFGPEKKKVLQKPGRSIKIKENNGLCWGQMKRNLIFWQRELRETLMKGSYVWLMFQLCASTLSQRKKMQMNIFQLKSRSSKRQWYIRPNRRERLGQSRNNLLRSLIFKGFSFEWDEVHCSDEDDECKQKKKKRGI